jgi:hypothetical protein
MIQLETEENPPKKRGGRPKGSKNRNRGDAAQKPAPNPRKAKPSPIDDLPKSTPIAVPGVDDDKCQLAMSYVQKIEERKSKIEELKSQIYELEDRADSELGGDAQVLLETFAALKKGMSDERFRRQLQLPIQVANWYARHIGPIKGLPGFDSSPDEYVGRPPSLPEEDHTEYRDDGDTDLAA